MTIDKFWKLISLIDRDTLERGDEDAAVAPLTNSLGLLSATDLEMFQDQLAEALYALDGKQYADNAGDSGTSDDGFLYCRCYVVAQGQTHYEKVRASPHLMPKSIEQWCESLLYCAMTAWAKRTGNRAVDWPHLTKVSYETGSNARLWQQT